jgi:hypothetical protein
MNCDETEKIYSGTIIFVLLLSVNSGLYEKMSQNKVPLLTFNMLIYFKYDKAFIAATLSLKQFIVYQIVVFGRVKEYSYNT